MHNKRVLITGASGFIGSTAVDKALELGYETWAGIRKSSSRRYLQGKPLHYIDLHYNDKEKLREQLREVVQQVGRFNHIIHIAGVTKAMHKSDFDRVNYQYTRNLVEALKACDAMPDTFLLMSSLSALGVGDERGYSPIRDDHQPNPNTAYGSSKLKAEHYLKGVEGLPYLILRPTGVYGPRDRDYLILMKAVERGLCVGAGFKKQLLTFIHSEDLASVIFSLIGRGITGRAYIVADGDIYSDSAFNSIVQHALHRRRVLKLRIPLFLIRAAAWISERLSALTGHAPTFNSDKYRIMKQRNWSCDISPLQEDIGFKPRWRLREGVEQTVAWYRAEGWL